MLSLLALFACQEPVVCVEGFEAGDDELCYAVADDVESTDDDTTITDLLDSIMQCKPVDAGTEIDFEAGCIHGLCAGMTAEALQAEAGEDGECTSELFGSGEYTLEFTDCIFSNGVRASFSSFDPDIPALDTASNSVDVNDSFAGASLKGIGIDASLGCVYNEFGLPESLELEHSIAGNFYVTSMYYDTFHVYDSSYDELGQDGLIDGIRFNAW